MKSFLTIALIALAGCASHQKKFTSQPARTLLFPNGVYHHAITLQTADKNTRSFNGVVRLDDASIKIVGLSPLNSTIFRIEENRATGKITTEVYHSSFKKFENRLLEFYVPLRAMMLMRMGGDKPPSAIEANGIKIRFSDYDENKVPAHIEMEHPNFTVKVEVTGYET